MDEESDESFADIVKQMSMSKSFLAKIKFCPSSKEAVFKTEIPKDFDKLDIVIGSKSNHFSVNYAN